MFFVKKIEKLSESSFGIEWTDGKWQEFTLAQMQNKCPCIRCKEGERVVEENVRAIKLRNIGRYALQIVFTSGCSRGIYTFSMLREMENI